jgi:para-nitrobenzyl esterase
VTTLEIAAGALRGAEQDGVRTFLGVPYAEPPVGELRFRAPRPVRPWSGERDATKWAARAPQPELTGRGFTGDEDCLYLNVYAPASPGSYPVLVWIHGGGGVLGAPHQFDGSAFARRGVVVVTVAYRLGVLGMLHLPGVADSNLSLRDQVAALEWVRGNAGAFGGDPDRVTLAGQSNGGRTVGTLLAVPATRGLVRQAIVQSGTGVGSVVHTPAEGAAIASAVLAELDASPEDLATLPVKRILEAQQRVSAVSGTKVTYRVVVGDELLPERPLDGVRQVPLLIGTTADEEDLFSWLQSGGAKLLGVGSTMLDAAEIEKAVAAYASLLDWPEDQVRNRALTAGDWWIPAIRFAEKPGCTGWTGGSPRAVAASARRTGSTCRWCSTTSATRTGGSSSPAGRSPPSGCRRWRRRCSTRGSGSSPPATRAGRATRRRTASRASSTTSPRRSPTRTATSASSGHDRGRHFHVKVPPSVMC